MLVLLATTTLKCFHTCQIHQCPIPLNILMSKLASVAELGDFSTSEAGVDGQVMQAHLSKAADNKSI